MVTVAERWRPRPKGPGAGGGRWHVGAKRAKKSQDFRKAARTVVAFLLPDPLMARSDCRILGGTQHKWIPRGVEGCALSPRAQSGMMPLRKRSRDLSASPDEPRCEPRFSCRHVSSRDAPLTQSSGLELMLVRIGAVAGELGELVRATFLGRHRVLELAGQVSDVKSHARVHPAGTGVVFPAQPNPVVKPGEASPRQAAGIAFPLAEKDGDNCWCRWNGKRCVIDVDDIDLPKAAMRPWMPAFSVVDSSAGFIFGPDQKSTRGADGIRMESVHPCSLLEAPFVLPAQSGKWNAPPHH